MTFCEKWQVNHLLLILQYSTQLHLKRRLLCSSSHSLSHMNLKCNEPTIYHVAQVCAPAASAATSNTANQQQPVSTRTFSISSSPSTVVHTFLLVPSTFFGWPAHSSPISHSPLAADCDCFTPDTFYFAFLISLQNATSTEYGAAWSEHKSRHWDNL